MPTTHRGEIERIKAAYRDREASGADQPYRFANPAYAFHTQFVEWSLIEALRRAPVKLEGADVLDVGCGTGYMLNRMVEFGAAHGTGVDLMPNKVETARGRYPLLSFVCSDGARMPFADGEFDVVTQFTCLSSVLDANLRGAIASEMWRVLRPGGVVVSFDLRGPSWAIRSLAQLSEWRRRAAPRQGGTTPTVDITAAELRRLFPEGCPDYMTVGLAFGLAGVAAHSYLAARVLSLFPPLREHAIGVAVKPQ